MAITCKDCGKELTAPAKGGGFITIEEMHEGKCLSCYFKNKLGMTTSTFIILKSEMPFYMHRMMKLRREFRASKVKGCD